MSDPRGADYRTSAAPSALESTCLLCGNYGEAGKSCATCGIAMPFLRCSCGTVHGVAATRCTHCSLSLVDAELATSACPRCASPLAVIGIDLSTAVHLCSACSGLFVPARAWNLLMSREDLVATLAAQLPAKGPPRAPDTRLYGCPVCAGEMERMRFAATSTVVINVCPAQQGAWLEAGDLATATAYALHRRAIGTDAAIAEAEARDRVRPELDPLRIQHQLAHQLALEARERGAMATRPAAPDTGKRSAFLLIVVAFIALYFVYSFTFGARHKDDDSVQDAHQNSRRELKK